MVGAAHRAGLLAFAECGVEKEGRSGSGRGDLWIACPEKHYWFEFKRSAFNPKAKKWGLKHALESAVNDIRDLSLAKGEVGIAGVIAATNNMKSGFREEYRSFVNNVDYAFHFGPDGSRGAYLFLKLVVK